VSLFEEVDCSLMRLDECVCVWKRKGLKREKREVYIGQVPEASSAKTVM
jgi:hypothetical protein